MQDTFTNTQTKYVNNPHALVAQEQEADHLTGIQENAVNLYERGFNVFPIPSAYDWSLRGTIAKTPYKVEPLYRNRMHYSKNCGCKSCLRNNFTHLFEASNIAIMCGATSGNLFAIDCDTHKAFKQMGEELEQHRLEFWAFTSHRGGSYLLRALEGEIANIPKSKFEEVQIWGYRHFVVAPPSTHPKGTVYQWISPEPLTMLPGDTLQAVSIDKLEWLDVKLKKNFKSKDGVLKESLSGLPGYVKNLSNASIHTLLYGAKQGGRNSALIALAADLVGIGLEEDDVENALQKAAYNCTPIYDDHDHKIGPILEWAFSKERKPSRTHQLKENTDVQNWQRAYAFASSYDWRNAFSGRSSYARRVFNACIERARLDCRSNVFRASAREVAMLAGMNKVTASKYLSLFSNQEPRLLEYKKMEKSGAYLYAFGEIVRDSAISGQEILIDILLSANRPIENNLFPTTDTERDAFYGLGIHAYSIWRALLMMPAKSAYQLAKRMKINNGTAGKTL